MSLRNIVIASVMTLMLGSAALAEDALVLKPDHPDRYVVARGDTLWSIAARFFQDPWQWPDIWEINPNIKNPHLIYPGDVVTLIIKDGKPVLKVEHAAEAAPPAPAPEAAPVPVVAETPAPAPEEKMPPVAAVAETPPPAAEAGIIKQAPQVRVEPLETAIPTIPIDAIKPFLSQPRVLTKKEADSMAYVIAMEEGRLIGGTSKRLYARKLPESRDGNYRVFRLGEAYRDPEEDEILGYEAVHVGDARLQATGDPATLVLAHAHREALTGDLITPVTEDAYSADFLPHAPGKDIKGTIISVMDAVSRVGRYQTVVLNVGQKQGIEPGHVLAVYQSGDTVRDTSTFFSEKVKLPDSRAGVVMVFRTFDKLSYALVMEAEHDIRLYDSVRNP